MQIGGKSELQTRYPIISPRESQNLVIMNPPFTRAMSDWLPDAEGTVKQYRGLGNTPEVQKQMKKRETLLLNGSFNHGSAGISCAFTVLADKMLKPGGKVALVLPLTAMQGSSWSKFRDEIE